MLHVQVTGLNVMCMTIRNVDMSFMQRSGYVLPVHTKKINSTSDFKF